MNIVASPSSLDRAEILGKEEYSFSEDERLTLLLDEAERFCRQFDVAEDIILETYTETSDWAFFIKVDALHETACRDLMARALNRPQSRGAGEESISAFLDDIDFHGRGSVLRLIELTQRPAQYVRFLKSVRRVREAFAHDLRSINTNLAELIAPLADRAQLLLALSGMADEAYDETRYMRLIRNDPGLLRFGILRQSMALLSQLNADLPGMKDERAATPRVEAESNSAEAKSGANLDSAQLPDPRVGLTDRKIAAAASSDRPATPAVYSRHLFINSARPNETRSLWAYLWVFSGKALLAIGGFCAAAAAFAYFGIWPAIAIALLGLIPIALDKWTPGAWQGACPLCDSQISVGANKKAALGFACPKCAQRISVRDGRFTAL
ncbi:hypothetical protein [Methylocapsa acidiphila]|uniref:hypothetical protein n=1 Tax=Methylocapsa acidiphila TaxID=133552 RepID=UPI000411B650|nr:hypothetical protein [Methylocapsa acidiphila]